MLFPDKTILGTDVDLKFLTKLDLAELRLLVACIREKIERGKKVGDEMPKDLIAKLVLSKEVIAHLYLDRIDCLLPENPSIYPALRFFEKR